MSTFGTVDTVKEAAGAIESAVAEVATEPPPAPPDAAGLTAPKPPPAPPPPPPAPPDSGSVFESSSGEFTSQLNS